MNAGILKKKTKKRKTKEKTNRDVASLISHPLRQTPHIPCSLCLDKPKKPTRELRCG
jgi:hypothetical protein